MKQLTARSRAPQLKLISTPQLTAVKMVSQATKPDADQIKPQPKKRFRDWLDFAINSKYLTDAQRHHLIVSGGAL
jgi:hypothetical protein